MSLVISGCVAAAVDDVDCFVRRASFAGVALQLRRPGRRRKLGVEMKSSDSR